MLLQATWAWGDKWPKLRGVWEQKGPHLLRLFFSLKNKIPLMTTCLKGLWPCRAFICCHPTPHADQGHFRVLLLDVYLESLIRLEMV